jgi:hypothetical protein
MMSLLLLLVVLFVVTRCAGACLRLTERSLPRGRQSRAALERKAEPEQVAPSARVAETALESLQRRFSRGEISVETYEREVGRLFGVKAEGQA